MILTEQDDIELIRKAGSLAGAVLEYIGTFRLLYVLQ